MKNKKKNLWARFKEWMDGYHPVFQIICLIITIILGTITIILSILRMLR